MTRALGKAPLEVWRSEDYMAVYEDEADIISLRPNFHLLSAFDCRGIIATAPGKETDFVSRFFAPRYGINEDPVTGSAHCSLVPYWADKLGKTQLSALQLSNRGGRLACKQVGNRVLMAGKAVQYLAGTIEI